VTKAKPKTCDCSARLDEVVRRLEKGGTYAVVLADERRDADRERIALAVKTGVTFCGLTKADQIKTLRAAHPTVLTELLENSTAKEREQIFELRPDLRVGYENAHAENVPRIFELRMTGTNYWDGRQRIGLTRDEAERVAAVDLGHEIDLSFDYVDGQKLYWFTPISFPLRSEALGAFRQVMPEWRLDALKSIDQELCEEIALGRVIVEDLGEATARSWYDPAARAESAALARKEWSKR
jgi:hypothetical protein